MSPDYEIIRLSPELVFICWHRSPGRNAGTEEKYLAEIKTLLDDAEQPLYFMSDLRKGRIIDIRVINQLVDLTRHRNWAGSTAFSQSPISKIFAGTFVRFSSTSASTNEMQDKPEEAIAFLESLKPGLTRNIDWNRVIGAGRG